MRVDAVGAEVGGGGPEAAVVVEGLGVRVLRRRARNVDALAGRRCAARLVARGRLGRVEEVEGGALYVYRIDHAAAAGGALGAGDAVEVRERSACFRR